MPHVVLAVAQWVGMTFFQVATAAGASITTAATIANVAAAATVVAEVAAVAAVSSALTPKIGGDFGTQIDFKADPRGPIPYAVGRTGVGGSAVFAQACGPSNKYLNFVTVMSGAGPIDSYESFAVNGAIVNFSADGGEGAGGYYNNRMWRKTQLGDADEPYLHWTATGTKDTPADHQGMPAEWTSAHKLSGYAADLWCLQYNTDIYSGGVPKRTTVGKWVKVYDPRKDSTYPGGSGSHRALDESTYEWSENPYLHALTWCLGRWVLDVGGKPKKIFGCGIPLAGIDVPAFVEGANVADANGWTVGGVVYSNDDKYEVLKAFLQAGAGKPMRLGAKMSCLVNMPRVSLASLTREDVVGDASITGTQPRRARLNTIWPKYREEAQGWEMVPMDEPVQVADYVTADGAERSKQIEYSLVQDPTQAACLARYDIEDSREFLPVVLVCKPKWRGYRPGDCITVDEPEFGLNGQKLLIIKRRTDPMTMAVTLTLRSETDGKHPFALGQTGVAPATPGLTGVDPGLIEAPNAADFTLAGVTLTSGQASFPAIQLSGTIEEGNAAALLIRYRVVGATDWQYWPSVAASRALLTIDINAVAAGETYEVEIAYESVRGTQSDWTAMGTATAGDFTFAELQALLYASPAKNLYRKADWIPASGAVFRDRIPLGSGVANGDSGWGFRFPAATNNARITVPGKTNGLISTGDRYATEFVAFLSAGTGTAQIRAGWRDAGGGVISDLPDQVYTVTTTPTRFVWEGYGSNDPDFTSAVFQIFELTGDIAVGKTVDVTDLQMEYGGKASSGWRPSPDDADLLAYAGYVGALNATSNQIYVQSSAPASPSDGDFWVDTTAAPYVLKTRVSGAWQVSAANGGAYGSNIYHTPGGTLATLSNFLTSSGIAAGIAGQGELATSARPEATLQYIDDAGGLSDWRGFGNPNGAAGMGVVFDTNPMSAGDRYITINDFNLKGQGYTRFCPGGVVDFGAADTTYGVVMHWAGGYFGAILVEDIDLYTTAGGWLYMGTMKTTNGGVFTPPAPLDGYVFDFGGIRGGVIP